jgi:predicted oxidoreductase (fatty acid repression mutant protein)
MHQYIVWTALVAEGLGCNLQHYQHTIVPYLMQNYGIEKSWVCKAQLVIGALAEGTYEEKPKTGLEEAMKVFE